MSVTNEELPGDEQVLRMLADAVGQRYAEKGVPAALRLMRSLEKRIALFTGFVAQRQHADAIAAQQIRLHIASMPRTPAAWASQMLAEDQRRHDRETLELLTDELRVLHRAYGMARMLQADPVFSLMAVDGSDAGADPVEANKVASQRLREYLLHLRAARLAAGSDWDRREIAPPDRLV